MPEVIGQRDEVVVSDGPEIKSLDQDLTGSSARVRISIQVRPRLQHSFDCQTRRRGSFSPPCASRIQSLAERSAGECPAPRTHAHTQPPPPLLPPPALKPDSSTRKTRPTLSSYCRCPSPFCILHQPAAHKSTRGPLRSSIMEELDVPQMRREVESLQYQLAINREKSSITVTELVKWIEGCVCEDPFLNPELMRANPWVEKGKEDGQGRHMLAPPTGIHTYNYGKLNTGRSLGQMMSRSSVRISRDRLSWLILVLMHAGMSANMVAKAFLLLRSRFFYVKHSLYCVDTYLMLAVRIADAGHVDALDGLCAQLLVAATVEELCKKEHIFFCTSIPPVAFFSVQSC
ncbi:hypothetical protein FQN60_011726 [Etheostoma spectabile]|uniref:G protein gamma domain-containing protein n=29 Tax=Percomorphaceae TaxID=1489872 RepID=A0A5J5DMI6_9PERO|nr:hypothetical protein FQN60_011726 [Etheostoma spectabile]